MSDWVEIKFKREWPFFDAFHFLSYALHHHTLQNIYIYYILRAYLKVRRRKKKTNGKKFKTWKRSIIQFEMDYIRHIRTNVNSWIYVTQIFFYFLFSIFIHSIHSWLRFLYILQTHNRHQNKKTTNKMKEKSYFSRLKYLSLISFSILMSQLNSVKDFHLKKNIIFC